MTLKNIFLGVALLLLIVQGFAQNCVRLISTRHDSAYNQEMATYFPTLINPWLNTFDFAKIDNGVSFRDIDLYSLAGWNIPGYTGGNISMISPFSTLMGSGYDYLWGPLGTPANKLDIHWQDGWEVMWINTGYYPNGEPINTNNPNRIISSARGLANDRTPYVILYNRYTGKLRVFANVYAALNAFDNARLTFQYNPQQNVSGVFRHVLNYDQTLDNPSKITEVSSTNLSNRNNSRLWWSSDFQLGYDPCVCKHPSSIEFKINGVSTMDIDLYGRSVGLQQNVNAYNDSFLSNETIKSNIDGGSLLFKSMEQMLDAYDNELEAYNTQMNSYNSFFNSNMRVLIKSTSDAITNAAGPFNPKPIGDIFLNQLVRLDGAQSFDSTISKSWANEVNKTSKGLMAKSFDFLSVAAFGDDFFDAPKRPSMPTATFNEMRLAGTITDNLGIQVSNLLTPASYQGSQQLNPYEYPAYNNAVGQFALLKTPVVRKFEQKNTVNTLLSLDTLLLDTNITPIGKVISIIAQKTIKREQDHKLILGFDEPLKYKLNRALDFDDDRTKIYVSFVVELENNISNGNNCFTVHLDDNSENFYLRDMFPITGTTAYRLFYESKWTNMEDIGERILAMRFKNSFLPTSSLLGTITINGFDTTRQGEFIDCINENNSAFTIKKIKMKIAADMYFDQIGSNGLQNNNFQSFTYLLYDADAGTNTLTPTSDSTEVLRYKQEQLVLTNETIETTDPFVSEIKDSVIYVNAKKIELNGNIDVQTGYTAVLQSIKSIRLVSGNTNVSNKVRLKNVNGFSPFGKNYETTQSEVDAFCQDQNNGYKALIAANKTEDEAEEPKEEAAKKIETSVYPNPAANQINIAIGVDEEKQYTFQVFDLLGRSLINETITGANQPLFEINTELLSNGTYLLRINSADGLVNETHRIVILK